MPYIVSEGKECDVDSGTRGRHPPLERSPISEKEDCIVCRSVKSSTSNKIKRLLGCWVRKG